MNASQVNVFLRELAGIKISLKDFRTLMASAAVLDQVGTRCPRRECARPAGVRCWTRLCAAADELCQHARHLPEKLRPRDHRLGF